MHRWRNAAIRLTILLFVMVGSATVTTQEARAETGGYPYGNYNGPGTDPNNSTWTDAAGNDISPYGYNYRNCTDYVAWKLVSLGVPTAKTMNLGNGGQWYDKAGDGIGASIPRGTTPAVGAAAVKPASGGDIWGHVAYVEAVHANGTITVSEYNWPINGVPDGAYHTRTGTAASMGFTKFVYFGEFMTNPPNQGGGSNGGGLPTPGLGSKIAAARHADGRLAVFYIGANSAIYYRNQNSPGSTGWTPEIYIPAYAKAIAAVTNADGRIELFYVGANNGLYHRWQPWTNTNTWAGEEFFSANIRAVAAANNGNGILAVIAVGSNNQLYIMQQPARNSWNGQWHNIPAGTTDIGMATSWDGRNELFHVGTNYKLYSRWEASPGCCWSNEIWFDANIRKVAATRNADGRMEVFAIGSNAEIYNKWQWNAGSNWYASWDRIPAQARYIAAATNVDGKVEIFYVGANSSVYHRRQTQPGCCWGSEDILPANVAP